MAGLVENQTCYVFFRTPSLIWVDLEKNCLVPVIKVPCMCVHNDHLTLYQLKARTILNVPRELTTADLTEDDLHRR